MPRARAAFGWSKLYRDEPRIINVDGKLWKVTVPFPRNRQDDYDYEDPDDLTNGVITFEVLGEL